MFANIKTITISFFKNIPWTKVIQTRQGLILLLLVLFWIKSLFAYVVDFNFLGITDIFQLLIALINPIAIPAILFGFIAFVKNRPLFYSLLFLFYLLFNIILFINVIYYREFSQFVTVNSILSYKDANQGLAGSGIALLNFSDIFLWLDYPVFVWLLIRKKISFVKKSFSNKFVALFISASVLLLSFNLAAADISRPQLLTRQFDNTYMVKYLGVTGFLLQDSFSVYQVGQTRNSANKSEMETIEQYVQNHFAKANASFFGMEKGKNVLIIHLESLQQVSIDRTINGQEVMPFLDSLYHDKDTIAFDNFFHQVGQGKTSDAENMLETSTYGLPDGSLFSKLGDTQTFQAMPAILNQEEGYSTAVFHGNVGSFWNRTNVYKNMGYQNFFDANYYDTSGRRSLGYGLKDKLLFDNSIKYLEQLQQPFYAKYLTVTNHFPFDLDSYDKDDSFTTTSSGSALIDGYWQTNHYLDESLKELFDYLKKTGLYDNTMIVLYGDHYAISDSDNVTFAKSMNMNTDNWGTFQNAQLQRVPFMIHLPGYGKGEVNHTYAGEIDVMPTIEHLLGIDSTKYIQFGKDIFSPDHDQLVIFRNEDFITPQYSYLGNKLYDNATGKEILQKDQSSELQKQVANWILEVNQTLEASDKLNNQNLLRFYQPTGFKSIVASNYDYGVNATLKRLVDQQRTLGVASTSLLTKNDGKSTADQYSTNAPELNDPTSIENKITIPDANQAKNGDD